MDGYSIKKFWIWTVSVHLSLYIVENAQLKLVYFHFTEILEARGDIIKQKFGSPTFFATLLFTTYLHSNNV